MKKKKSLYIISSILIVPILCSVYYFMSTRVSESELEVVNKAYKYYGSSYAGELPTSSDSLEDMKTVLSDVIQNDLMKKAYKKSDFKKNEEKIDDQDYQVYQTLYLKKYKVFNARIEFLYFRSLLYSKDYDLYLTEFMKYYPYLDSVIIFYRDYIRNLEEYGALSNEDLNIVIKGFEQLRNLCEEEDDIYVCAVSQNDLYRLKDPNEVPDEIREYVKNYAKKHLVNSEKNDKLFLPITWDGFDLNDVTTD